MFKLLPQQEKARLQKEYRTRLAIVALIFLLFVEAVGIASLLPAFFLSRVKDEQIKTQLRVLGELIEEEKDPQLAEDLERAKNQIKQLVIDDKIMQIARLFDIVSKDRAPGVIVTSFELMRTDEGQNELRIIGNATSRDALVMFSKTLEKESMFTKVEFPVSDLAQNRNIAFSMTLFGTF